MSLSSSDAADPGLVADLVTANHILDLRTDGGNFTTEASEDVINAIRQSAVAARLTTTGSPSWRS